MRNSGGDSEMNAMDVSLNVTAIIDFKAREFAPID
jgi:hypothetical protein